MYQFIPQVHKLKNKKALSKADIWPRDLIIFDRKVWLMTAGDTAVKLGKLKKKNEIFT